MSNRAITLHLPEDIWARLHSRAAAAGDEASGFAAKVIIGLFDGEAADDADLPIPYVLADRAKRPAPGKAAKPTKKARRRS